MMTRTMMLTTIRMMLVMVMMLMMMLIIVLMLVMMIVFMLTMMMVIGQAEVEVATCWMLQGLVEECGNLWTKRVSSPSYLRHTIIIIRIIFTIIITTLGSS